MRGPLRVRLAGIIQLLQLISGQQTYALVLFLIMLLAALAEGFGLSLVLPLLSGLIGLEMDSPAFSGVLAVLLKPIPEHYRLEGLLAILVVAFICKSALMILQTWMSVDFALRLRSSWASQVFKSYLRAPYEKVIEKPYGTLVNNTILESLNASKAVTMALRILSRIIVSTTLLVLLVMADASMVIIVATGAGLIVYGIWNATHRYSKRFGKERLTISQQSVAMATEGLSGVREVKVLGMVDRRESGLKEKLERFRAITTRFKVFAELPANLGELVMIVFLAILLTVVHLTREVGIKEFIPVLGFFVVVSQRLMVYLSFIVSKRMDVISLLPSVELMHSLLIGRQDVVEDSLLAGDVFARLESDIVLKNVWFSYSTGKHVLKDVNMVIPIGKVVGLIGPSGTGKSTVADLLLRLLEPKAGQILVNGRELRDWDLQSWRSKIGYVSQELFIFNTSIRENILIGKIDASDEELFNAAILANVHDFVEALPKGYDTVVGERGVKLSGGQKQRIAIARAIIRNPELYIFDEATSSLDRESEKVIQRAINTVSRTRTSLVIAHRLTTLKDADVVYELTADGNIEVVPRSELRARSTG